MCHEALRPHHCSSADTPIGDAHLRLERAEHETAETDRARARRAGLLAGTPESEEERHDR